MLILIHKEVKYGLFVSVMVEFSSIVLRRSRLLTVRKSGFHPGNRGSIPLGITNKNASALAGAFLI